MIDTTLAHYKITDKLGQGGMGEVWRAEDTRLGRDVALKMLPETLARDPERLARFEREARVLASLSHPNIAGIFGLEEDGGRKFLVMEVAEGETLADRIARGRISAEESARIAVQIAEALEEAHAKGIVHRDLKPANVKLGADGRVKVLDFGLAKALTGDPEFGAQDLTMSPTLTQAMTGHGVLLGTAGYMSPEQARAQPADQRADVWAFGCVLFEMLTGERTFKGDTATDILGAIVHKEPELDQLPPGLSPRLRRLIERCLRKDADRRLQAIGDARIVLQDWLEHPEDDVAATAGPGGRNWPAIAAAAFAGAAVALVGVALWPGSSDGQVEPVRRFEQTVEDGRLFTDFGLALALSRDGRRLAYDVARDTDEGPKIDLLVRSLDQQSSTTMVSGSMSPGSVGISPFFSPDGEWLAYFTGRGLVKTIQGGSPIQLVEVERGSGGSWNESDRIVYGHDGDGAEAEGLFVIAASGGEPEQITTTAFTEASHEHHRWPQWLPGDRAVLFAVEIHGDEAGSRIEAVDLASGERTVLHRGGSFPHYAATGHLLFVNDGTLYALAFDPDDLEVSGAPMPVLQGASSGHYTLSADGLLAYVGDSQSVQEFPIVWADRKGQTDSLVDDLGLYGGPVVSPAGDRLAVSVGRGDDWDVWVFDLERGVPTRLTFGDGYDADVVWSPDGRHIAFTSDRLDGTPTVFRKRSDGLGDAEVLLEPGQITFPSPMSWSPDGSRLIVVGTQPERGSGAGLWFLDVETGEIELLVDSEQDDTDAQFSPDGRYIAYRSAESGESQIYVLSADGEGKWQISNETGAQPRWSSDGDELFYRAPGGLMRVEVDTSGTFRAGRPEFLFSGPFGANIFGVQVPGYQFHDYTVAPDGRFVTLQRRNEDPDEATRIQFVTGWYEELRTLTGSDDS